MFNLIFQKNFKFKRFFPCYELFSKKKNSRTGIIYTLYSDKFNLIELGFAKDNNTLEDKLNHKNFILLDKKEGEIFDLFLSKETLKLLGVEIIDNNYFNYSDIALRHLKTLGWPIGTSLYKRRIIRKKLTYA